MKDNQIKGVRVINQPGPDADPQVRDMCDSVNKLLEGFIEVINSSDASHGAACVAVSTLLGNFLADESTGSDREKFEELIRSFHVVSFTMQKVMGINRKDRESPNEDS